MLFRIAHRKNDHDFAIESFSPLRRKVGPRLEDQSISTCLQGKTVRQKGGGSAIRIGGSLANLPPGAGGPFDFKPYHHATSRASSRGIENVCSNRAHSLSSFSNLSRVIFRCSSAATRNSVPGSFRKRALRIASISSEVFPVAQTMKMKPKRSS